MMMPQTLAAPLALLAALLLSPLPACTASVRRPHSALAVAPVLARGAVASGAAAALGSVPPAPSAAPGSVGNAAPPRLLSPRLQLLRTLVSGGQFGAGCDVQDPSPMVRDPKTQLWHFWSVFGCGGTCGWAGHLRHWYSDSTEIETARFLDGGIALNHSSDPHALDSNGQFSPGIFYDAADATWYLFFSATGKNGTAARSCIGEPTGCTSSQMVASSSSPHGPWAKLGAVSRALDDGSWNERLVDCGRALLIQGRRGYYGVGFVSAARYQAGHVEDVEGVYRASCAAPSLAHCAALCSSRRGS
eukprot:SAG31_NODE_1610_length_7751_cov_2.938447_5_plen_303_part_00